GGGAGGGQPDAAAGHRRLHRPPGRARPADGPVGGSGRGRGRRGGVGARDRRGGPGRANAMPPSPPPPPAPPLPPPPSFPRAPPPRQRPVRPADALASLLLTAGVPAHQTPPGVDARAAVWRVHAAGKKILLVLDDAAGHQQVRPLLPGTPGSLVLITSRRRLA